MAKIIDAFPHILPRPVLDRFCAVAEGWTKFYLDGFVNNPALVTQWDLSERFRLMDQAGDYAQVPTLNMPPIEHVAGGRVDVEIDIARLANDTLAELVRSHPERFKGFAAALPMDDPDASVAELDRAVGDLGALGAQIFTNANGVPLDDPRFEPLFARCEELDCLVWVHGARASTIAEFARDADSRYGMWLSLGWPFEMGLLAGRLALSGLFDRHPGLKLYLHHSGGMVATFGHRIGGGGFMYGPPGHEAEEATVRALRRPVLDYLREFYVDTSGNSPISITAALSFFGSDRVLLGSDAPFRAIADHLAMIESMSLSPEVSEKVTHLNAERVLKLG